MLINFYYLTRTTCGDIIITSTTHDVIRGRKMKKEIKEGPLTETAFLILLAMYKPNHGYGVMQFVEEKTKGRVVFGPGTLYGAINNLAKKKWIEPCPVDPEERKKDYIITELGRAQVELEMNRLEEIYNIAIETVKGGVKDEKDI